MGNISLSCLLIAKCKQCLLFYAHHDLCKQGRKTMANKENAVLEHDMKMRHVLRMLCFFSCFLEVEARSFS